MLGYFEKSVNLDKFNSAGGRQIVTLRLIKNNTPYHQQYNYTNVDTLKER